MALGLGLVNSKSDYTVGWEPSDQDDLVLWLKNDIDVSPSMWKNQADLTSPFIQGTASRQPDIALIDAINSQEKTNDLIFDGTDDVLAIDGADITVSGAFTFVIVFKPDAAQSSTLLSGEPANSYLALGPQHITGNKTMTFNADGQGTAFDHGKAFVPNVGDPELQYYIIQRASNGNMTSESSVWGSPNTIIGQGNAEDFTINKVGGSVGGYYDGQIKEIFLFESIFENTNDYRLIHKYLDHKFGIPAYS
jgi:hypothetical protein